MKILEISFKRFKNNLYLFIYYDNGEIRKYKVKDKFKEKLLMLLVDITILDKYN